MAVLAGIGIVVSMRRVVRLLTAPPGLCLGYRGPCQPKEGNVELGRTCIFLANLACRYRTIPRSAPSMSPRMVASSIVGGTT